EVVAACGDRGEPFASGGRGSRHGKFVQVRGTMPSAERCEYTPGLEPLSRIHQNRVKRRQIESRAEDLAAAVHHATAEREADRDIGTRLLRSPDYRLASGREVVPPRDQPQRRSG